MFPKTADAPAPRLAIVRADSLRAAADGVVAVTVARTDSVTPNVIRLSRVARRVSRETFPVAPATSAPDSTVSAAPHPLVAVVDSLTDAVSGLIVAHEAERVAWSAAVAAADSQRVALQTALNAATRPERCGIGPVPCPTRRMAFMAGFTAAVVLFVVR